MLTGLILPTAVALGRTVIVALFAAAALLTRPTVAANEPHALAVPISPDW